MSGNEIIDKKWEQGITSEVYILRNTPVDLTFPERTSAERLIQIFTP